LGCNFAAFGYTGVLGFFAKLHLSEREHLMAFVAFVKYNRLDSFLKNRNWVAFARGYNGPSYEKNGYHTKLADRYAKHAGA